MFLNTALLSSKAANTYRNEAVPWKHTAPVISIFQKIPRYIVVSIEFEYYKPGKNVETIAFEEKLIIPAMIQHQTLKD